MLFKLLDLLMCICGIYALFWLLLVLALVLLIWSRRRQSKLVPIHVITDIRVDPGTKAFQYKCRTVYVSSSTVESYWITYHRPRACE